MSQLELSGAVLATAAAVYVVPAALWRVRDDADRAAAAHLDAVEIDPYHAVATACHRIRPNPPSTRCAPTG